MTPDAVGGDDHRLIVSVIDDAGRTTTMGVTPEVP
jgi:hypothetical protein